ncbi:MAG: hypothetical protein WC827_03085 [Candidatus Paceibacterota bacterium]|jgi:hypothetical protein
MEELLEKIKILDKIWEKEPKIEKDILGINEATTKLWQSTKSTDKEREIRIANVFIGAFITANRLGIKDITKVIKNRLTELESELK